MSNEIKNPPAYPFSADNATWHGADKRQEGMSLRDYFAAKVLCGLVAQADRPRKVTDLAFESYVAANAMLEERMKYEQGN